MVAVPLAVRRQVADPEVGRQVDDGDVLCAQRRDDRRRRAVRVGDDRRVEAREVVQVELLQRQRHAVARVDRVEPRADVAARRDARQLETRMAMDDPRRERAGEAAGAGDEDPWLSHGATPRCPPGSR